MFFKRVLRFVLLLCGVCVFCAALLLTALQTEKTRPVALEISNRASHLWNSLATSQAFASEPSVFEVNSTSSGATVARNDKVEAGAVQADKRELTTVETIEVVPAETSTITRTFTGVLTPAQSSDLGFKRIDRIVSLTVDQGDRVKAGDTLAVLDTRSLHAEKCVLLAELRAAKAQLAELEAGPRQQTIDAARARLQELQSLVELAKITSERQSRLVVERAGSQQQFDNARLQRSAADSRYQSQLQIVRELEAGTREEQLEAQRAAIEKLEAGLASLEITIEESTLKAPYDAIVSKRMADEGMTVAPGSIILRLVERGQPEAWIGLPPGVAAQMETGSGFQVTLCGKAVDAVLKSVLPELDVMTRTQTAVFVVDLKDDSPRFGQVVRLEWQQQESLAGYWVPTSALTHGVRGLWSVFVAERTSSETDGAEREELLLSARDVEVLRIETDRVLLRGTLKRGDSVVAAGVQKLVAGQTVRREKTQ